MSKRIEFEGPCNARMKDAVMSGEVDVAFVDRHMQGMYAGFVSEPFARGQSARLRAVSTCPSSSCSPRSAAVDRVALRPLNDDAYARGYLWMCVSFGVFFFAVGAKCAMEPVSEFATASDTSVVGILLVSSAFL